MKNLDVIICGIGGRMGRTVYEAARNAGDISAVAGVDTYCEPAYPFPLFTSFAACTVAADTVIDFSRPEALGGILDYCRRSGSAAVLCTTGYGEEHKRQIEGAAADGLRLFQSSNMSVGVNLLNKLVKLAAEALGENYDIEIVEKHHNKKADSPSGTALTLANSANSAFGGRKKYVYGRHAAAGGRENSEIGIHAVRGGTIPGEHEVIFAGPDEIITLSHTALSRAIFAEGALRAARFLADKPAGLYSMADLV